ncbi:hypothetical protein GCM10010937_17700 [Gluconobacter japonicus]|uniref:Uncharacterized protein n=1 Tax=Gluconobacter japonicus TaxID=376620 RepID=A0ABQ5WJ13_GLUJA|nr:hypothetical protein AA3271_0417 [Gluconobacter japonicus NBRC 3271]GLQ59967.1 hypothetical protein GCM10010937_17700 [Gluconobacter japonicus]
MQACIERAGAQEQNGMSIRGDFGVVRQSKRAVSCFGKIDHAGGRFGGLGRQGSQQGRKKHAGQQGSAETE